MYCMVKEIRHTDYLLWVLEEGFQIRLSAEKLRDL